MERSVLGSPGRIGQSQATLFSDVAEAATGVVPDNRFQREKQGKFAERVRQLNEARLEKKAYPAFAAFKDVEKESGVDQVCCLWMSPSKLGLPNICRRLQILNIHMLL